MMRGLPSQVNGAGLRTLSLRGSWVQKWVTEEISFEWLPWKIPPPALINPFNTR